MDTLDKQHSNFLKERIDGPQSLFNKFKCPMVGTVVDTNDPLNMHRLRIKIPELHDWDMADEDVPWARPVPWMGGPIAGSWTNYQRGDLLFVVFEKNHPYSILYTGSADATRRSRYVLDSIYSESPPVLDENGDVDEILDNKHFLFNDKGVRIKKLDDEDKTIPHDYVQTWLPHDRRPASTGLKDHYGNCFIMKSVGWNPHEHERQPTVTGNDPLTKAKLDSGIAPSKNEPDAKYMAMYSKYGNSFILSDVGYQWWEEFKSNWDGDKSERAWERDRCNYFTKALTEQEYKNRDQRRVELRTRYGHLFEMRDVGWDGARDYEYSDIKHIQIADSKIKYDHDQEPIKVDHRWIKWRTKGGHLIQMCDKGMDYKDDDLVKKRWEENEFGEYMDQECPHQIDTPFGQGFWHDRADGRFMRFVTRHGYKLVLDDRGTNDKSSQDNADQCGNGFLIKGRRKGRDGVERGFGMEFNEKTKLNHMILYSPKSKVMEINDEYDYMMMSTDTFNLDLPESINIQKKYHVSESMVKRADNEFTSKIAMGNLDGMGEIDERHGASIEVIPFHPEMQTHHMKLDKHNGYIRLKTHYAPGVPAGVESRDGTIGGNWTEINDHQDRGLWFSGDKRRSVWRSQTLHDPATEEPEMWQTLDEQAHQILIVNNGDLVQIYCKGKVQVISEDNIQIQASKNISIKANENIYLEASNNIHFKAGNEIISNGGNSQWVTGSGRNGSNVPINAPIINADNPGKAQVEAGSSAGNWPVGVSTPDGEEASSIEVIEKHAVDKYKPDEYLIERAADSNIYEKVIRKEDIWGET